MTLVRDPKAKGDRRVEAGVAESRARYAEDGYSWALQQAALLRAGRLDLIDADNIADEMDALAKTERRMTRSAIRLVLHHLLKWDRHPSQRSRSWMLSIREHRRSAARQLNENPGLQPQIPQLIEEALTRVTMPCAKHGCPSATFHSPVHIPGMRS